MNADGVRRARVEALRRRRAIRRFSSFSSVTLNGTRLRCSPVVDKLPPPASWGLLMRDFNKPKEK